jgi:drug/metabolite transporter (DMT)-like permease
VHCYFLAIPNAERAVGGAVRAPVLWRWYAAEVMASARAHVQLHLAILGLSFTAILGKLIQMGVVHTIWGRSVIAAAVLAGFMWWRGERLLPERRADQGWNLLAGVFLAGHWVTFFQAVRVGPIAPGLLGLFTFPIMLTFLEPLVFREPIRRSSVINGLATLGGIALVVPSWDIGNDATAGLLWGLASAVLYSVRNLVNRRLIGSHSASRLMFGQLAAGAVLLSPAWLFDAGAAMPLDLVWLVLLGVVCTAVAHSMFVASFGSFRVATASIILTLEPIYAILLAIPVFGEWPPTRTWLGGLVLLAAVAHESYRSGRRSNVPAAT